MVESSLCLTIERGAGKNGGLKWGAERKAKVEWLRWVLEYAWGLRALSNAAKMKQAAEFRGKPSIPNIIISQQSYSDEKEESKSKLSRGIKIQWT